MAREEKTISELTSLATVNRSEDLIPVVDVSDTTDSEYGTTKKTLVSEFIGDKGEAATVDAGTTTTGDAGTNASVVNVGTTSAAVFNFTIPRGNTGANGEDGLDINWRGNYASGTAYVINDAVFYSGSSYICKLASTGNLPTNTTYWDLMAQQGAAGTGSGDVSGPASATDNAIARFDLTTGKLIQDSLVTVDDNGSINIPSGQQYLVNGSPVSGYSDEQAQDAVGTILTDTTTVDFTYTDGTPSITADVKDASVANAKLANMATKTYKGRTSATTGVPEDVDVATLKTDLALVKADVGLGNVDNTSDATKNSATVTLTNKTLTSPVLNTGVSGTAVLDEDDMASNSATKLATQQSIKAYVDAKGFVWKGPWTTLTPYDLNDTVESNGSGYVCTSAHTSGGTTEPGVGASWTDKWDLFVEGTDKTMPTGDIVGTTDTQTLTNKTIDGDTNTISNLAHGAEVDNPASGVHGVTGSVVGTTDTQTLTNKTIDGDDNTVQDLPYSAIKSTSRSGLDEKIITGTPNTTNLGLVQWNSDGDAVDSLVKPAAVSAGWIDFPFGTTCTYVGADDPTYTMYVSGDASSFLSIGMKFECFQSGMKFFFITAIGAYDSGNDRTLVTLYGGTDYDLANAEIGLPAYSMVKSPYGFPMSPAKWRGTATKTGSGGQANPSSGTWYNLQTFSIVVPIGMWRVGYSVPVLTGRASAGDLIQLSTLSTGNNNQSDQYWTVRTLVSNTTNTEARHIREGLVEYTSKTTLYFNGRVDASNVTALNIQAGIADGRVALLYYECAYL